MKLSRKNRSMLLWFGVFVVASGAYYIATHFNIGVSRQHAAEPQPMMAYKNLGPGIETSWGVIVLSASGGTTIEWSVQGERYGAVQFCQTFNGDFKGCHTLTGSSTDASLNHCPGVYGPIFSPSTTCMDGSWKYRQKFVGISAGTWTEWVTINGVESNRANFKILPASPLVHVASPNGGGTFSGGQKTQIQWNVLNIAKPICAIDLYRAGQSAPTNIASNLVANANGYVTSYAWRIPLGIPSSQYKVLVRCIATGGNTTYTDQSDQYFNIITPKITVLPCGEFEPCSSPVQY